MTYTPTQIKGHVLSMMRETGQPEWAKSLEYELVTRRGISYAGDKTNVSIIQTGLDGLVEDGLVIASENDGRTEYEVA